MNAIINFHNDKFQLENDIFGKNTKGKYYSKLKGNNFSISRTF